VTQCPWQRAVWLASCETAAAYFDCDDCAVSMYPEPTGGGPALTVFCRSAALAQAAACAGSLPPLPPEVINSVAPTPRAMPRTRPPTATFQVWCAVTEKPMGTTAE